MKRRAEKKRLFPIAFALAVLAAAALGVLFHDRGLPRRQGRGEAPPPGFRPETAGTAEVAGTAEAAGTAVREPAVWGMEQSLLAAANERMGAAPPPDIAALFRAAEDAVRAVLPGEEPLFAAFGVPGTGVTLLGDGAVEVSGIAALADGRRKPLRYRVRVLFLPGKYLQTSWPEWRE